MERIPLRGIRRTLSLSLEWLLQFIAEVYEQLPDDLYVQPSSPDGSVQLLRLEAEADELWSFVGKKSNKQWVWLAFASAPKAPATPMRLSLSFSKKLANHIGAIKYFICHYNQEVMRHA